MLLIGEKITVTAPSVRDAVNNRDAKFIQELATVQVEHGANMLDLSIGPATKGGPEMMEWLVKTVQAVVDVPCSLDTTNPEAIEAGCKVHKGQALINSTTADPERMDKAIPLAKKYDTLIIGLTMTEAGIPRDVNERLNNAMEIVNKMFEYDVPLTSLYFDPLILSIGHMQFQAQEVLNTMKAFKELHEGLGVTEPMKTIAALSNVYNGCPAHIKHVLGSTYIAMLMTVGTDAIILNTQDKEIMDTIKSVQVFKNEVLYAHSYLD